MNKEERLRALMIQRGEILPETDLHLQQTKKKEQSERSSAHKKQTAANKKKTAGSVRSGSNKKAVNAGKTKKTGGTQAKRRSPAVKSVSKNVSISTYRMRQQKRQQKQALIRLCLYAGALIILILVIVMFVRGCKDPGELREVGTDEISTVMSEEDDNSQGTDESDTGDIPQPSAQAEQTPATQDAVEVQATVSNNSGSVVDASAIVIPRWIQQSFIRVNEFSRPQIPMQKVEHIAIHWVGNAGSSASGNREYFDNLGNPQDPAYGNRKASAHFVVGLEGEIIQCMPLNEMAYAVRDLYNPKTISIEVCHKDWDGKFSEVTYNSVVKLSAWLMQQFGLEGEGAILRHHDCDGKDCPKYYVNNPDEWKKMQQDILNYKDWNPSIG